MDVVVCPTCDDSKPFTCCDCGCDLSEATLDDLAPDPYAAEIGGCKDLHLQCDLCSQRSAWNI